MVLPSDVDEVVVHRDPVSAEPIQHVYAVQHHLFRHVISGVMRVHIAVGDAGRVVYGDPSFLTPTLFSQVVEEAFPCLTCFSNAQD